MEENTSSQFNIKWDEWQGLLRDKAKEAVSSGTCPSCGYCPHCGRGGYRTIPYYPYPYPYYPNTTPWVTYTVSSTDAHL